MNYETSIREKIEFKKMLERKKKEKYIKLKKIYTKEKELYKKTEKELSQKFQKEKIILEGKKKEKLKLKKKTSKISEENNMIQTEIEKIEEEILNLKINSEKQNEKLQEKILEKKYSLEDRKKLFLQILNKTKDQDLKDLNEKKEKWEKLLEIKRNEKFGFMEKKNFLLTSINDLKKNLLISRMNLINKNEIRNESNFKDYVNRKEKFILNMKHKFLDLKEKLNNWEKIKENNYDLFFKKISKFSDENNLKNDDMNGFMIELSEERKKIFFMDLEIFDLETRILIKENLIKNITDSNSYISKSIRDIQKKKNFEKEKIKNKYSIKENNIDFSISLKKKKLMELEIILRNKKLDFDKLKMKQEDLKNNLKKNLNQEINKIIHANNK